MAEFAPKVRRRRKWPSITMMLLHFRRERLTQPGQFVAIGAVATGIAAVFPEKMVGTLGFSFFAGLLVVGWAACMIRKPPVSVKRVMAERCMAGEVVPMILRVHNESKKDVLDLGAYEFRLPYHVRILENTKYVDRLTPDESHEFKYPVHAPRRGHYTLPGPCALSSFPFGLMHRKRFMRQTQRLVVYPRFKPLRRFRLAAADCYQPGGVAWLSRVGESMEFVGNREYRAGDRVRDIHPRSWARVGYPVVRQFEQEFLTRVAMLVDTFVPWYWKPRLRASGTGWRRVMETRLLWGYDQELLEANLSLAASVAECLAREEYVVDLFAAGPQLYHFQAGRSLAHLDNILDILACIDRSRADPLELIGPSFAQHLRQTSTVIAMFIQWDATRDRFVTSIREQGVNIRPIVLTDDPEQAEAAVSCGAVHVTVEQVEAGIEEL